MQGQGPRTPQIDPPASGAGWFSNRRSIVVGTLEFAVSAALLGLIVARLDIAEIKQRVGQLSFTSALVVAGLMLVRAIRRRREYAIRLAIGARRGAILRQSFLEGLLLSVAGGLLA